MRKSLLKIIILCFILSVIFTAFSITFADNEYQCIIEDDYDLLTDEEEAKLKEYMIPITEYGNAIFHTTGDNRVFVETYADNYYHSKFSLRSSGVVFVIDMGQRQVCVFSDGFIHRFVTNQKADVICDNIYTYAKRGDYFGCAQNAFKQIYNVLKGEQIAEPLRIASGIAVSIILAFFITYIVVMNKYRVKPADQKQLIKNCNVAFAAGQVSVVKTGEHRVYNPPSSSSGGGGGGRWWPEAVLLAVAEAMDFNIIKKYSSKIARVFFIKRGRLFDCNILLFWKSFFLFFLWNIYL